MNFVGSVCVIELNYDIDIDLVKLSVINLKCIAFYSVKVINPEVMILDHF